MGGVHGTLVTEEIPEIKDGYELKVVYDGIEYNTIAKTFMEGALYAGNGEIVDSVSGSEMFNDTGEPFVLLFQLGQLMIAANDTKTEHSVSVTWMNQTHVQIDAKYLNNKPGRKTEGTVYEINGTERIAEVGAEIFNFDGNQAYERYSHAEGYMTLAFGQGSHAEGNTTKAYGDYSHTEGEFTVANGYYSHAEGGRSSAGTGNTLPSFVVTRAISPSVRTEIVIEGPRAYNAQSHAEGCQTLAFGNASHAEGIGTIADDYGSHAEGRWNIASDKFAHVVGNGSSNTERSNAHTLDWSGNAEFQGDVIAYGCGGESPISLKALLDRIVSLETELAELKASALTTITDDGEGNVTIE